MSKRTPVSKDSYSYIVKKIRKPEDILQQRSSSFSSPDAEQILTIPQEHIIIEGNNEYVLADSPEPTPSTSASYLQSLQPHVPEVTHDHTYVLAQEAPTPEHTGPSQTLQDSFMEILGPNPTPTASFGKEIQRDLAVHYECIATSGMSEELRTELVESHLPPMNCTLIAPPSLNPEIKAAVSDSVLEQDKKIQFKQNQIGSAIACLSEALTNILSDGEIKPDTLKLLVDTGRILCDSQHKDSITRRNNILAGLRKDLQEHVKSTKIDSLLFGQQLPVILKTANAINASGAELKSLPPTNRNRKGQPRVVD